MAKKNLPSLPTPEQDEARKQQTRALAQVFVDTALGKFQKPQAVQLGETQPVTAKTESKTHGSVGKKIQLQAEQFREKPEEQKIDPQDVEASLNRKIRDYMHSSGHTGNMASLVDRMQNEGLFTADEVRRLDQERQRQTEYKLNSGLAARQIQSGRMSTEESQKLAEMAQEQYESVSRKEEKTVQQTPYAARGGISTAAGGGSYGAGLQAQENREQFGTPTAEERTAKAKADYYQQQAERMKDQETMRKDMEEFSSWPAEDRAALERYIIESDRERYDVLSEPSFGNAQYNAAGLFDKYGAQKVAEIAESYRRQQNAENSEALSESSAEWAKEHPFLNSVGTVGANVVGAVTSPVGYLGELVDRTGRYSTLDPNNVGNLPGVYSGAVRSQVASDIEGEDGNVVRKALSYGYQGVMAAADSLARVAAGGGSKAFSLGLAASGSFGQTLSEASRQGATPSQAVALATANSFIEVGTEFLPLDELLKTAKGGARGAAAAIKSALKQGSIEIIGEEASFLGSLAVEAQILREKNSYNQQIADLVANGMSYQNAKEQADLAVWNEALQTAIVSGISGGASSIGSSAAAKVADRGRMQNSPTTVPSAEAGAVREAQTAQPKKKTLAEVAVETALGKFQKPGTEAADTMVDSEGNYARIEESPSGNSKNGLPMGPEHQQGRDYAGPEGLSEGSNPTANAEPMPLPDHIISNKDGNVNGDSVGMDHGAVGAAESGFTGKQAYYDILSDENSQPDRPGDVRPMEVPKTDGYGRRVSEFAANAYGAGVTPDAMADRIQELIMDGAMGFDTRTNEESLKAAADAIEKRGAAATRNQITRAVAERKIKDGDIEKAMLLYATYANRKSQSAQDNAAELAVDLATMANITGRNLQLFKLLRKMTPEGQLMAVQKTVQRNVNKINSGRGKRNQAEVEIPQELQDDYLEAAKKDIEEKSKESAKRKEDIEKAIYTAAASQIKSTFAEKWNAWRYMAMMGNVKTQARNVAGNALFVPYTEMKRVMGAAVEKMLPRNQRTKAVLGFSEGDKQLRQWARNDAKTENVSNALKYSARLGDDVSYSVLSEGVRVFDNGVLERARKITKEIPEKADILFKNREYTESLAGFLKARGYTAADIESGRVSDAVLNEGRAYAINEAMKATFNDCNAFSDAVSSLRYKGDNPVLKAVNTLGEGILPFRRTPANIVVRLVENSPVGIVKSAWNAATKVRTGEMSAATAIDQLAAGLTGTGMTALGYFLAKGIGGVKITGSEVDEDEERKGHQPYALEFSWGGQEYSYKIDWAAPANLPLFIGANLYSLMEGKGADTGMSAFTSFIYSMGTMFEPLLSLSCMSSLNDLFEAGKYAGEGEAMYSVAAQAATSYIMQGIPALLRQTYQASQGTKQQTFANSEDPLIRDMQRTAANIPFVGAEFQTDAVDEWGEAESRGNVAKRIFDAYFNPGTLKAIDNSALEEEITRLNEAQSENVSPPGTAKTITYTDAAGNKHTNQRLTETEYNTLTTVQGQTAKAILGGLVENQDYKALTDAQKAKVFEYVYEYAREKARTEAISGYPGMADSWMEGIEGKEGAAIVNKVASAAISDAFSAMTENWRNGGDGAESVEKLEEAFTVYEGLSAKVKKEVRENASGRVEYYLNARAKGIDTQTFTELYKTYYSIDQSGGNTSEKAQKWAYELEKAKEARTITEKQKDALKESMKFYQTFPAETEKFDQMTESGLTAQKALDIGALLNGIKPDSGYKSVRDVQKAEAIAGANLTESEKRAVMKLYLSDAQDENLNQMISMGYDAATYAAIYEIYSGESGEGKKKRTIARIRDELGVDEATAKAIYEIYG